MRIEFQDGDSIAPVIESGLMGYTAEVSYKTGGPALAVSIVGAERDKLIYRGVDETGGPFGPTMMMPLDDIDLVSVV